LDLRSKVFERVGAYANLEYNMGNSRAMLEKHYLNFPSKEESLRFWAIKPSSTE
jgi:hypothetical protein